MTPNPSNYSPPPSYSFKKLLWYFLKLGTTGFGGPIALVGYMQRDLEEQRQWLSREEYIRGLALSQLAPGPLAAQLAIYVGYIRAGVLGATLVGLVFILPSFVMVVALGWLYVRFGGLGWMQALFYGIGAAVIGIIIKSAYKLTRVTLQNNKLLWLIFLGLAITTAYTRQEIAWLFILGGLIPLVVENWRALGLPKNNGWLLAPLSSVVTGNSEVIRILLFFTKAGLFVFGSGLAVVPFLYGGVVEHYHWLTQKQFLDAVAVAMITPGPVVITVAFIGYLVAGLAGASAAAVGVFLPVYLFVVIGAPLFEKYGQNRLVKSFVSGVTAGATGAIAGALIILGRQSIYDLPTFLIAAGTLLVLVKFKIPEPILIVVAGALGLLLFR